MFKSISFEGDAIPAGGGYFIALPETNWLLYKINEEIYKLELNSFEWINQSCECNEDSYSNKPIAYANMTSSDQQKRTNWFELFKPEDFMIGCNVDSLMKVACDQKS